jgi:hypothetical protein
MDGFDVGFVVCVCAQKTVLLTVLLVNFGAKMCFSLDQW